MAYAGEVKLTHGSKNGSAWRHLPPPPPRMSPRAPTESWWIGLTREQFSIIAAIQYETRMKVDTTEGITQAVKRGRPRKDAIDPWAATRDA